LSFGGTFDLIDPRVWDLDIIDDTMGDTGDILDDFEHTQVGVINQPHLLL
jgi:hypothetical protein